MKKLSALVLVGHVANDTVGMRIVSSPATSFTTTTDYYSLSRESAVHKNSTEDIAVRKTIYCTNCIFSR